MMSSKGGVSTDIVLSIIIPVYNAQDFIEECLDSIFQQRTDYLYEVIIVNDGSNDDSERKVRSYLSRISDSRFKVYTQTNSGVSVARNKGIDLARGKYLMFVDADDSLKNDEAIQVLLDRMESSRAQLLIHSEKTGHAGDLVAGHDNISMLLRKTIANETFNPPWNKVYLKSVIRDGGVYFTPGLRVGEDLEFNVRLIKLVNTIAIVSGSFYEYRTDNSMAATKTYNPKKYDQLMYVNDTVRDLLITYGFNDTIDILKYIRVKNILSAAKDVAISHRLRSDISRDLQLMKMSNKWVISRKSGLRAWIVTVLYSIFNLEFITVMRLRLGAKYTNEI